MVADVEILPSASRHGVADQDILHALANAFDRFEEDGFVMFVGADHAGRPIELAVRASPEGPVVFHAMPARPKYLR